MRRIHPSNKESKITCAKKKLFVSGRELAWRLVTCRRKKSCIEELLAAAISIMRGVRPKMKVGPAHFRQQEGRSHQKRQQAIKAEAARAFSEVKMLAWGVRI